MSYSESFSPLADDQVVFLQWRDEVLLELCAKQPLNVWELALPDEEQINIEFVKSEDEEVWRYRVKPFTAEGQSRLYILGVDALDYSCSTISTPKGFWSLTNLSARYILERSLAAQSKDESQPYFGLGLNPRLVAGSSVFVAEGLLAYLDNHQPVDPYRGVVQCGGCFSRPRSRPSCSGSCRRPMVNNPIYERGGTNDGSGSSSSGAGGGGGRQPRDNDIPDINDFQGESELEALLEQLLSAINGVALSQLAPYLQLQTFDDPQQLSYAFQQVPAASWQQVFLILRGKDRSELRAFLNNLGATNRRTLKAGLDRMTSQEPANQQYLRVLPRIEVSRSSTPDGAYVDPNPVYEQIQNPMDDEYQSMNSVSLQAHNAPNLPLESHPTPYQQPTTVHGMQTSSGEDGMDSATGQVRTGNAAHPRQMNEFDDDAEDTTVGSGINMLQRFAE